MFVRHNRAVFALAEVVLTAVFCLQAAALDIEGALNVSLDQPRINAAITLPGDPTSPLTADTVDIFGQPVQTFNIQAFYDTGASGILMSKETADALGVPRDSGVVFEDVGVGGTESFDVSTEVGVHVAPFTPFADVDNPATFTTVYDQVFTSQRLQISQTPAGLAGPLDVFGMPLFTGKSVVMDVRQVNNLTGTMDTTVYNSGAVPGSVPNADYRVQMTYGDFSRFTQTTPGGATGPTLSDNPFIGPDPVAGLGAAPPFPPPPPSVVAGCGGSTVAGSWLFDTGAAASIISQAGAAALGVTYAPGTYGTETPVLNGLGPGDESFVLTIGGVGGTVTIAGFFLDSLAIPTLEGEDIVFTPAPVMVFDITLLDPLTSDQITLDGIFGMNFLVASGLVDLATGGLPIDLKAGAFDFLVFDQPSGILSLMVNPALLPEPVPGDINGDGQVDGLDLNILGGNWQASGTDLSTGDLNGDGVTDGLDLNILGGNWQAGVPAPGAAIPEPATLVLIVTLGGICGLHRRRHAGC